MTFVSPIRHAKCNIVDVQLAGEDDGDGGANVRVWSLQNLWGRDAHNSKHPVLYIISGCECCHVTFQA